VDTKPKFIDSVEVPINQGKSAFVHLRSLMNEIASFDFQSLGRGELEGLLPRLQESESQFIAQYLKAVLAATAKPLEGRVQIHPAIKVAMGDAGLSASKAAGIIKGLLKNSRQLDDPTLMKAYEIATRLRPTHRKGRNEAKSEMQSANSKGGK
jgi:hypothetical protein